MNKLISLYLDSKKQSWSASTLTTATSKLGLIDPAYLPLNPADLHAELTRQGYGAYTIKQLMLLATQVCKHACLAGEIPFESYTQFMHDKRRLFAGAYAVKKVGATFESTLERIKQMPAGSREFALGLIASGLRISEAAKVDADGQVIGKGGKVRSVPNADMVTKAPRLGIQTFRRELKAATGLTPHALRKLAATKFVEFGAREAELCVAMGWSSYETASIYIQASNVDAMSAKMKKLVNG